MEHLLASGYYFLERMLRKTKPAAGSANVMRGGHRVNKHKAARVRKTRLQERTGFPCLERFLALQPKYKQTLPKLVYDSFDEFD
jgi:hypothetical protein